MTETPVAPAEELAAIRQQLTKVETMLKAVAERVISSPAVADEVLTSDQFLEELAAAGLKRGNDWLYDQIRMRRISPLRHLGKRPYQFLRSEKWKLLRGNHR